ncbi:fluoride efflux transporter CrcB [Alteromonas oceanisediminis]|uniref:fluoride efflux transporter CrcB n=1 Tax=Alteromonas oceanisediminis TaxID=2836180 RepID=UPI001BD95A26|nr:fluoride efflux transporter CrcB [Alteromonas oceanisediminis]MBT0586343.1 fluoride efflux transporter CrcB [Alteromonas oceanisediminis]
MTYIYIALGGAIGACLRWFITMRCEQWFGKGLPFGTLAVNVVGSFLLGVFYALMQHTDLEPSPSRAFLAIGMLGALTTFSTFSYDTLLLLQHGEWLKAFANIVLNVMLCLAAAGLAVHLFKG